jgi:2-hydroxychromene-2-carboxylate isomerase
LQEPKTIGWLYKAAWQDNINIGDKEVLRTLLRSRGVSPQRLDVAAVCMYDIVWDACHSDCTAGFDADKLLEAAEGADVKETLRKNNQEAVDLGLCGVPSFHVSRRVRRRHRIRHHHRRRYSPRYPTICVTLCGMRAGEERRPLDRAVGSGQT